MFSLSRSCSVHTTYMYAVHVADATAGEALGGITHGNECMRMRVEANQHRRPRADALGSWSGQWAARQG